MLYSSSPNTKIPTGEKIFPTGWFNFAYRNTVQKYEYLTESTKIVLRNPKIQ